VGEKMTKMDERYRRAALVFRDPVASKEAAAFRAAVAQRFARSTANQASSGPSLAPRINLSPSSRIRHLQQSTDGGLLNVVAAMPSAPKSARNESQIFDRIAREVDGTKTVRQIASSSSVSVKKLLPFFGKHIGSYFGVVETESPADGVEAIEIIRLPAFGDRTSLQYLHNNCDVRRELIDFPATLGQFDKFLQFLRLLHVTYIMGSTLDCFYLPGSCSHNAARDPLNGPGQWRKSLGNCPIQDPLQIKYFRLLAHAIGDRFAQSENFAIGSDGALLWGWVGWEWTNEESLGEGKHSFHPPRLLPGHFERLWEAASATHKRLLKKEMAAYLKSLAKFLRLFVCAHPFEFGNMGLAMNIVNWFLRQSHGGYIPHFELDWCAQRFEERTFIRLFERTVDRYLVKPNDLASQRLAVSKFDEARLALEALASTDLHTALGWLDSSPSRCKALLLT
jgi:hypothetical protein